MALRITGDERADALLAQDPFALLVGMLLDQQVTMEKAFTGPVVLVDRLAELGPGEPGRLDPAVVAAQDPESFARLMRTPPAVHRYPGSMAGRVQALAAAVVEGYGGRAERIWTEASSGADLFERLRALPGFGEQKARIFVALLGKQCGVDLPGWREAAGPYGEDGSYRSVADVVDRDSLLRVREYKQEAKRAAARKA